MRKMEFVTQLHQFWHSLWMETFLKDI